MAGNGREVGGSGGGWRRGHLQVSVLGEEESPVVLISLVPPMVGKLGGNHPQGDTCLFAEEHSVSGGGEIYHLMSLQFNL